MSPEKEELKTKKYRDRLARQREKKEKFRRLMERINKLMGEADEELTKRLKRGD